MNKFDIIVVGGGHAGVEAALLNARLGNKTLLITMNKEKVANTPCNPSIGGPAKGVVVREIDALGGEMAKAVDATALQIKMLNTAKGPGVQSLRAQIDKIEYSKYMLNVLENTKNLQIKEAMVDSLIVENSTCIGVKINEDSIYAKSTILTTGTYMEAEIFIGHDVTSSGPEGDEPSIGLSKFLSDSGFKLLRLKTGTPARILKSSIDYSKMEIQTGTEGNLAFSYSTKKFKSVDEQEICYLIHTTRETKKIVEENLEKSAMYGGEILGVGPRYCPSFEDKIVKFADKERHQIFIEPESVHLDTMYLQGLSTSMPHDIQEKMVKSLPGLEKAIIKEYAYAIEYDAIDPTQLWPSLETKILNNLYTAGQINGTSGYEEAAAQGLIAGINSHLKIQNKDPLILGRDEAYIGVMIDDLVTKGIIDPYRLLTSRAEFRLLLRHDNANLRLNEYAYQIGIVNDNEYKDYLNFKTSVSSIVSFLQSTHINSSHPFNNFLKSVDEPLISNSTSLSNLLKRSIIKLKDFIPYYKYLLEYDEEILKQVEIQVKYEGYINKQLKQVEQNKKLEGFKLPNDLNYLEIDNLAIEARQKLQEIKPLNIGQASRISGVNPADISILLIHLKSKGVIK